MLRTHIRIHKNINNSICKCALSKEHDRTRDEVNFLRSELKNEIKTLKEFNALKHNDNIEMIETMNEKQPVLIRESVIVLGVQNVPIQAEIRRIKKNHTSSNNSRSMEKPKCDICNLSFDSDGTLNQHMLNEHKERLSQLNCNLCSFQASTRREFINHIPIHGDSDPTTRMQINQWKCRNCEEFFESKVLLMNHRRDNHDMLMCYFDMEDRFSQSPERCWYKHRSHKSLTTNIKNSKCYSSKEEFNSIGNMMDHRKEIHPETVKPLD